MIVDEFYNTRYVNSGDRVHRWCQDTTIDTCGVTRTLRKRMYGVFLLPQYICDRTFSLDISRACKFKRKKPSVSEQWLCRCCAVLVLY